MSVRALLITSALLAAASAVDRSTCGALWFFKLPCAQTAEALGSRVKAWSTQEGHGSREQCMYEARSTTTSQNADRPDDYCLLHSVINVQYVALRALPPELENGVEEDHHAQGQDAGDSDGHGFLRAPRAVQFDDDVHVAVVVVALLRHRGVPVPVGVGGEAVAAHEVPQDGPRVAGLHAQHLVVELPVLLPLVEVDTNSAWRLNFTTVTVPHGPVSFEEVGFGDVLPPDSCLDALSGHAAPEQRDVLRVRRLESRVLEDPETVS
ncbi:hypothetical protein EYF80_022282 [Liparis tanakae]|uniref:Uncharacterized protein n=1 Tax=Liparis tanakae TaxID=230148 RepID=A0A4Z2HNM8_9TELE|nr:hypothetical protein EYF80_022282 [Liparis tanakae]